MSKISWREVTAIPEVRMSLEDFNKVRDDAIRLEDALEAAWGIIANAGGGDWSKESPEWREAAGRWRDDYFKEGGR